jgi:hypothetical protein
VGNPIHGLCIPVCHYRTVLIPASSIVIDHLVEKYSEDCRKVVAYWFCDDVLSETGVEKLMLNSLIRQLLPTNLPIPDFVRSWYDEYRRRRTLPDPEALLSLLCRLIHEADYDVYLILDDINHQCGLASQPSRTNPLSRVVRTLARKGYGNIHVLLSSAEKDLTDLSLDSEDSTELFITLDLTDNPDLEAYMQHEIPNLPLSMVRSDFVGSNKKTASRGGRTVSTMPHVPSTKI